MYILDPMMILDWNDSWEYLNTLSHTFIMKIVKVSGKKSALLDVYPFQCADILQRKIDILLCISDTRKRGTLLSLLMINCNDKTSSTRMLVVTATARTTKGPQATICKIKRML